MIEKITVYTKPTCSTCREVDRILRETGEDYEKIEYYVDRLSEAKLKELLKKMNVSARDLLRTKESKYKELGLNSGSHSDAELIKLMCEYPDLMQRPIVEKGSKAVLARPAESIRTLLN